MMSVYAISNFIYRIAGVLGAILVMRVSQRYLNSVRFYAVFVCLLWIAMLPWLLFFYQPDQVWLIYPARILEGIGAGMGGVLLLSIAMRVCPKTLEGFTFALIAAAGNFGDLALGTNTVTAFAEPLGGMIPALFVLFLYALVSIFFLRPVLHALTAQTTALESA
jgi:MFS family permease